MIAVPSRESLPAFTAGSCFGAIVCRICASTGARIWRRPGRQPDWPLAPAHRRTQDCVPTCGSAQLPTQESVRPFRCRGLARHSGAWTVAIGMSRGCRKITRSGLHYLESGRFRFWNGTPASITSDVESPSPTSGFEGSIFRQRVANAIARREAARGWKRSCGQRPPDPRDWPNSRPCSDRPRDPDERFPGMRLRVVGRCWCPVGSHWTSSCQRLLSRDCATSGTRRQIGAALSLSGGRCRPNARLRELAPTRGSHGVGDRTTRVQEGVAVRAPRRPRERDYVGRPCWWPRTTNELGLYNCDSGVVMASPDGHPIAAVEAAVSCCASARCGLAQWRRPTR
jgi:hypothetical protein